MTATDVQHDTMGPDRLRVTASAAVLPDQPRSRGRVEEVLRILPSHGWTAGWIGRRDRALLVLCQIAGLSYENAAALTAGDLTVVDGVATIRTKGGRQPSGTSPTTCCAGRAPWRGGCMPWI